MKQSTIYIKWFCRALLLLLLGSMGYIASRPEYNFAHWIPHGFLRDIGLSYATTLWAEQHADYALHFGGALLLVWLLCLARVPIIGKSAFRALISVVSLCISAELFQLYIGRGMESGDLLLGIMGSFVAYLATNKNKYAPN